MQSLGANHRVTGTVRENSNYFSQHPIIGGMDLLGMVDAYDFISVESAISVSKPDAIVNCIGMIKQQAEAKDPQVAIYLNALFPHKLAELCRATKCRLIHISTDCVFNGRKGGYTEDDPSDAEDLYGRTKYLGEVTGDGVLTLRTSIIGRELGSKYGLVEWLISNRGGKVKGYAKAIYTGFTTIALSRIIADILENHPALSGLWHVSSDPISKYELLKLVNDAMKLGVAIERDNDFICDRSLSSARFRNATGFTPPSWERMIAEMVADDTPYDILNV
jgi:dTDP-4-dehydrorhamnose reductase